LQLYAAPNSLLAAHPVLVVTAAAHVSNACRTESSKKKPPIYKVMLHNDNYNRREYVVKVLLKTVEGLTVDDAVNVMQVRGLQALLFIFYSSS
jgi:hypothetical protein